MTRKPGNLYDASPLIAYLDGRGIKARWLAGEIGVHESVVSRLRRGTPASERVAVATSRVLGVPFGVLFLPMKSSTEDKSSVDKEAAD